MKIDARERQSELEGVPLDQGAVAELETAPADQTKFSSHPPFPAVHQETEAEGMPYPVQPSASDRAYGAGKHHGAAAPHAPAAPAVDTNFLVTTVRRVVDGVTIVAPPGAHIDAVDKCAEFVHLELGRNQYAQRKMAEARATIVIIPARTKMTDLPEFSSLRGRTTFDGRDWSNVRGSGGLNAPDGSFAIGVAEENLRSVIGVISSYPTGYSIGMHELAHAVESKGMSDAQKHRVKELYQQHIAADRGNAHDTFTDGYAAENEHEYFAQSTNAFFNRNVGKDKNGRANHNGRAWLAAKDPNMYAFLVELYETNHDADGKRVR